MLDIFERTEKERIDLEKTIEKILSYAKKQGADQSSVFIGKDTGIQAKIRNQEVEKITFSKDRRMHINVICNHCSGTVVTTDLSDSAIYAAVDGAIAISKHTQYDEYSGLAEKEDLYCENIDLDKFHPVEPDPEFCISNAIELERLTIGQPFIKQTINASCASYYGQTIIGNSLGQMMHLPYSYFSSSITLMGEKDGYMEMGGGYHGSCDLNELWSKEIIAKEALEDTISKLGAKKLQTMDSPVILESTVSPSIFSILSSALSGRKQFKKTSFINDCLDKQLFPEWINIYENPHIKKDMHSCAFDSDGARTIPRNIVQNGVIKSYLLSAYSARQLKMKNTGNGNGSYTWEISNSGISKQDLLKKMDKGLVINEFMGEHLDPTSGDFSFGASGYWIENGIRQFPVNEITIAGNMKDIFKNIEAIANDYDPRFSKKSGSILLNNLKIAGK